jgi:hypothetical protein
MFGAAHHGIIPFFETLNSWQYLTPESEYAE